MLHIIDRTEQTADIDTSRQRSRRTGRFLPIFGSQGRRRTRSVRDIDCIVLHATGFSRIDAPGRDRSGSEQDDFDHTIAHFVVRQNGDVIRLRPYEVLLNNTLAESSVSIEFEGNFPPFDEIQRNRIGRSRHTLPLVQLFAGRALVQHIVQELNTVEMIFGHRQKTTLGAGRANCPGPYVWYNVGKWAVETLGLRNSGHGAEMIPVEWLDNRLDLLWGDVTPDFPTDEVSFRNMIQDLSNGQFY
ncbi:MAG: N-acetylmuramoyl-L-alanine amidase [Bacteroidetes bacterium]|nr:MAG: N-acetylmuramoyl-L-alanine amidase [Bacteroidota bacterium]